MTIDEAAQLRNVPDKLRVTSSEISKHISEIESAIAPAIVHQVGKRIGIQTTVRADIELP